MNYFVLLFVKNMKKNMAYSLPEFVKQDTGAQ